MIDNGMPCVLMRAIDLGLTGTEAPSTLETNATLRARLEAIRRIAGARMTLGDVAHKTVPKMTIISPPQNGGAITTRTFIPHTCHKAIGVLGAVSVATACLTKGTVAEGLAEFDATDLMTLSIEHPSGEMTIMGRTENGQLVDIEVLRTARKLMDGAVFASSKNVAT
jgi:4-oxalomesaconate tautomerase